MPPNVVAEYEYTDEQGALLFVVCRLDPKGFRQRKPDGEGGWNYRLGDTRKVLYRLPQVLEAKAKGEWIYLVEGEKDVHTLERFGKVATTAPGGSKKWTDDFTATLTGAKVVVLGDNDEAGVEHVIKVCSDLDGVAEKLLIYSPKPGKGKDISDVLAGVTDAAEAAQRMKADLLPFDLGAARKDKGESGARYERIQVIGLHEFVDSVGEPSEGMLGPLIRAKERLIIGAFSGHGKALDVETPIPTPSGWRKMGDLIPGDTVYGADGKPTSVVATSGIQLGRPCYTVRFSDGSEIVADAEHRWTVHTNEARKSAATRARRAGDQMNLMTVGRPQEERWVRPSTVTTTELAKLVATSSHKPSIPCAAPVERPAADLPLDPYVLGVWLGDGDTSGAMITSHVDDAGFLASQFAMLGEPVSDMRADPRRPTTLRFRFGSRGRGRPGSAQARLRSLGVLGVKRIPRSYLEGSVYQRQALLQGLVDSDGHVLPKTGQVELTTTLEGLRHDVMELCWSLGIRATVSESAATLYGVEHGRRWRIQWTSALRTARLPRKADLLRSEVGTRATHRYVVAVEPVSSRPVQCIAVDAPDHLFLAGRQHIATHNTTMTMAIANAIVRKQPFLGWEPDGKDHRVLILDVEQGKRTVKRRAMESGLYGGPKGSTDLVWMPDGLALDSDPRHVRDIEHILDAGGYDVVIADPLYKLHRGDANDERAVVDLMRRFDAWREHFEFALIIPMHCRKPTTGSRGLTVHDISGSAAYVRGAETIVGLERKSGNFALLHWWKDREGDLPALNSHWKLLYSPDTGYHRDTRESGREPLRGEIRDYLESAGSAAIEDLMPATGGTRPGILRALEELGCTVEGTKKSGTWTLPVALFRGDELAATA
jgi:5S rRNA maturation endonuclease (ribonuclease M5)